MIRLQPIRVPALTNAFGDAARLGDRDRPAAPDASPAGRRCRSRSGRSGRRCPCSSGRAARCPRRARSRRPRPASAPPPRRPRRRRRPGRSTAGTPAAAASRTTAARAERVERHDDDVRHLRQRGEVGVGRAAVDLVVARVDEVAAGLAPEPRDVVADRPREVGARRRADDRDGPRREQRPEVDRSVRGGARARAGPRGRRGRRGRRAGAGPAHPTTTPTPRRSSERAMIRRWISLVPSQIRSTRSSRR